jgi:hypothetical protein
LTKPELLDYLHELEEKVLGCWCKPKACHGDILVKLVKKRLNKKKRDKISKNMSFT